MKIKMLVSISGVTGSFAPGEEVDWADKKDAERLIAAGFAEKVGASSTKKMKKAAKLETAASKDEGLETAV
tara:strand:+ start:478 stop:690 length:213 start_codon:yes stop_codon:yes gene_type:complete